MCKLSRQMDQHLFGYREKLQNCPFVPRVAWLCPLLVVYLELEENEFISILIHTESKFNFGSKKSFNFFPNDFSNLAPKINCDFLKIYF